jgi:hypothetical protein
MTISIKPAMPHFIRLATLSALSIASCFALSACKFSVSTAALDNVKLCSQVAQGKRCSSDTAQFDKNTTRLIASADLNHAPKGTKVKIDWNYLGGGAEQATPIDSISLETKDDTSFVTSSLPSPKKGWPTGEYEVVFSLGADNSKPIHKKFSIVSAQ